MKNVYIACDHAALDLKKELIAFIGTLGFSVTDLGPDTADSVDYPEYAGKVAKAVQADKNALGVLICGTGIGMSLAANKYRGIRAAAVSEVFSARMSRVHNNANIVCIGARVIGSETAKMIVEAFLTAEFEAGGRHERRVAMIDAIHE